MFLLMCSALCAIVITTYTPLECVLANDEPRAESNDNTEACGTPPFFRSIELGPYSVLIGRMASKVTPGATPVAPLAADWAEPRLDCDFREVELVLKSLVAPPIGNVSN